MDGEKTPLAGPNPDSSFYSGKEVSTGNIGSAGLSRRILHGLTIISVLVASGCTIYGCVEGETAVFFLPFFITLTWLLIHFAFLYFAKNDQHDFHPPPWFVFISSGHIFMQALVVIILTLFKKPT